MKKLNKKAGFALMLCLSVTSFMPAMAQREKPVLTYETSVVPGKAYYLMNAETGLFVTQDLSDHYSGDSYDYLELSECKYNLTTFIFEQVGSKCYIKKNISSSYCYLSNRYYYYNYGDPYLSSDLTSSSGTNYRTFLINQKEDSTYTIHDGYYDNNYYYGSSYMGTHSSTPGSRLYCDIDPASGNPYQWRLISEDNIQFARLQLYHELEAAEEQVLRANSKFEEIFNTSDSVAEIRNAAVELGIFNNGTVANVYTPSWSDYTLTYYMDPECTMYTTGTGFRLNYKADYAMKAPKMTLNAMVEVGERSTLVYTAYSTISNGSYSPYTYHNEMKVYIDGALVRHVSRYQMANSSANYYPYNTDGRYCETLEPGLHTITWEFYDNDVNNNGYSDQHTNRYSGYDDTHLCEIGIVNTEREISVSLKEPGSLGTEILAQINSVFDVRRLKIKGEMNAEDWATIDLIDKLFSLDLSEAVITEIPDNQFEDHPWLYELKLPEGLKRIGKRAFWDSYVKDVNIPSSVEVIDDGAFQKSHISHLQASHSQLQRIGALAFADCVFLEDVFMPTESMSTIGAEAFEDSRHIETAVLSKNMQTIENDAFRDCYRLRNLTLPEQLNSMGTYAFYRLDSLRGTLSFPKGLSAVPDYSFYYCDYVDTLIIPNDVKDINQYAFYRFYGLDSLVLPDSLTYIGQFALAGCGARDVKLPATLQSISNNAFGAARLDSLFLPEGISLGNEAFYNCNNLKYAELPTTYYSINATSLFKECDSLNHIKIKSPTKLYGADDGFVSWKSNVILEVPDYLVNAYKLDSYWYTYKDVIGFATSEVDKWTINQPLTLEAASRLQGAPDVELNRTTFTMKGEDGMELHDFNIELYNTYGKQEYKNSKYNYYYNRFSASSQVLSSADIEVSGQLSLDYYSRGNYWCYIALPFDIKVSDIQTTAQYAIRYYDGTSRADSARATGNWKNYGPEDIIPAGTGFIYQTSTDVLNKFVAYENNRKNRALTANDLATPLKTNACENAAHRGWNLVGNPWMTYFNIHAVDFTAPITVYDATTNTYKAYSIIDDNIALHPTQAFFVQCPDDVENINFPARGRQLSSVVTDQNGAATRSASARQIIDLNLNNGDASDDTRVVINEAATMAYDYGCDASKFFAEGNAVQLYTTDAEQVAYAINERPSDDALIPLAYMAPQAGVYTLSLSRNQAGTIILKDLYLNTESDLSLADYEFSSEAGLVGDRFQILLKSQTTAIDNMETDHPIVTVVAGGIHTSQYAMVYTVDGRLVAQGEGFIALNKGVYVVQAAQYNTKVVLK